MKKLNLFIIGMLNFYNQFQLCETIKNFNLIEIESSFIMGEGSCLNVYFIM